MATITEKKAQLRRDAVAWVETEGIKLVHDYGKNWRAYELGQHWIGVVKDPRNLLMEAYESLHPITIASTDE